MRWPVRRSRRSVPRPAFDSRDGRTGERHGGTVSAGLPPELRQPDGDAVPGHRAIEPDSFRGAVPRRADHARPDFPLRRGEEVRDRLPGGRHQPHGLVPEGREERRGPLPAAAQQPGEARVLRQREGARRGGAAFRILLHGEQWPPVRLLALVPQERGDVASSTATSPGLVGSRDFPTPSAV